MEEPGLKTQNRCQTEQVRADSMIFIGGFHKSKTVTIK